MDTIRYEREIFETYLSRLNDVRWNLSITGTLPYDTVTTLTVNKNIRESCIETVIAMNELSDDIMAEMGLIEKIMKEFDSADRVIPPRFDRN